MLTFPLFNNLQNFLVKLKFCLEDKWLARKKGKGTDGRDLAELDVTEAESNEEGDQTDKELTDMSEVEDPTDIPELSERTWNGIGTCH